MECLTIIRLVLWEGQVMIRCRHDGDTIYLVEILESY
jgi:hypothetical protein